MKLSRLFTLSTLLASSLFAIDLLDNDVLNFEKNRFLNNQRVKIENININLKRQIPQKDWYGYILDLEANMAGNKVKAKDILFSNGKVITSELFDLKTGKSYKELMNPSLTKEYYNKEHLIAGNINAKNRLVIFSDLLCPFCMEYVPDVIEYVKKHSDNIALFYYHFPLIRIHPASEPLSRIIDVAKQKGIKDIVLKAYLADWDEYFKPNEKDAKKILEAFNKEFKTSITLKEINNDEVKKQLFEDMNMGEEVMVGGTPTIFVNGEQDKSKLKYKTLGK